MLQTYKAQLNGSQLTWIDLPPAPIENSNVLVVLESADQQVSAQPATEAYSVFMLAKGCLGTSSRAQIDAELAQMRSEWDRPLAF